MNYLDELNPNQLKAVTTSSPKVLVMAGAGSGKTRVLTNRIRYLIDQGESEYNIVAFTFTNKAAREMKIRLYKEFDREINSSISTFHSFCYSYISMADFYKTLGFKTKPQVISESDKNSIIRQIIDKYNKELSTTPFVTAISKIKNKADITEIHNLDKLLLNRIYHEYQDILLNSSMIDFDDMIPMFIKLYKTNPILKDLCSYKYILVDECQDTNVIQFELINLLASYNHNIFMVGDEDQLIYSFRNSTIEIINEFKETSEVIILNQNYRCNKLILEKANNLISYNTARLDKKLVSDITPIQDVIYGDFINQVQEAQMVAKTIKRLIEDDHIAPDDIAILYRNNHQSFVIENELNKLNIPFMLYGDNAFYEEKIIKNILYIIRLLFNPRNEVALSFIYSQPFHHVEYYEYKIFIDEYHKQDKDLIEYLSTYDKNPNLKLLGSNLKYILSVMHNIDSKKLFREILNVFRIVEYCKEYKLRMREYDLITSLEGIISQIDVNELNEYINSLYLDNELKVLKDKVALLTIHKSKGLEFDTVFVVDCNQEIIPGLNRPTKQLEEERRLMYVAMTRAKQRLYLYSSTICYINGNAKHCKPSNFLSEAKVKGSRVASFYGKYFNNR